MFHSHITKALVCPSMSYIILYTKFALYISKRMSVTVTKTYDDKKETVLTEISILYLTSNKLLLRKSYPCQSPGWKFLRKIFWGSKSEICIKNEGQIVTELSKNWCDNKHKIKRRFSFSWNKFIWWYNLSYLFGCEKWEFIDTFKFLTCEARSMRICKK